MTTAATVRTWLEGLGLQAAVRQGPAGEEVGFGRPGAFEQPCVVR